MSKITYIIFHFCILSLLFLCVPTLSSEKLSYKLIQKEQKLRNCKVKVDTLAMYSCEDGVYMFYGNSARTRFERKVFYERPVIDADIDQGTAIMINRTHLIYVPFNDEEKTAEISDEIPMLARIKIHEKSSSGFQKKTIVLVVKEQEREILDPKDETKYIAIPSRIKIYSWFFSRGLREYKLFFPQHPLLQNINENSFRDLSLMNDPRTGDQFAFFGLHNGVVAVFRISFDSAEISFVFAKRMINENEKLIGIQSAGTRLILLSSDRDNKAVNLWIYKLDIYPEIELTSECLIDLTEYGMPDMDPEVKVKYVPNYFVIAVNYPGEKIILYSFKHPELSIFSFDCQTEPEIIKYAQMHPDVKAGFSFDFFYHHYIDGYFDHGFLLSPLAQNPQISSFIPYCLPFSYLDEQKGCLFCSEGFSRGGQQNSCSSCKTVLTTDRELVNGLVNPINQCPIACKNSSLFGEECVSCDTYMAEIRSPLPEKASWGIEKGVCTMNCPENQRVLDNKCVSQHAVDIFQDHCSHMTDCLNCSLSESCSWCDGACKSNSKCSQKDKMFLVDYLNPALKCEADLTACGPSDHFGKNGNLSFSGNTVYKNHICIWRINPPANDSSVLRMSIEVSTGSLTDQERLNLPLVYVFYCQLNSFAKQCYTRQLQISDIYRMPKFMIDVTDLEFYIWVQEDMVEKAKNFNIKYSYEVVETIFTDMFALLKYSGIFLIFCILMTCALSSMIRFRGFYRRRRLLLDIQGLDDEEDEDGIAVELPPIDPDRFLSNSRVVTKIIFDEKKQSEYQQTDCSICLDEFKQEEHLAMFNCKHVFHRKCIEDWVKINIQHSIKCPICNRVLA